MSLRRLLSIDWEASPGLRNVRSARFHSATAPGYSDGVRATSLSRSETEQNMRSRKRKTDGVAAKPPQAISSLRRQLDDLAAELQVRTAERDEALAQQNASASLLQ